MIRVGGSAARSYAYINKTSDNVTPLRAGDRVGDWMLRVASDGPLGEAMSAGKAALRTCLARAMGE